VLEGKPKSKCNLQHHRDELSDSELDLLWKTIDLNDSEENGDKTKAYNQQSPPKRQPSPLNNLQLVIEKYIPGGRFFLYSLYFPIWKMNLSVASEWQAQLQTILGSLAPNKLSKACDPLKNNSLTQLFFTCSPRGVSLSPKNQKETTVSSMLKQSNKKLSN